MKRQLERIASLSAFYRKLARMEPAVPAAIVRETASRARELIEAGGGFCPSPSRDTPPGSSTATSCREPTIESTSCARLFRRALPGKSLAIYEPASGLVRDIILEENAHTQERALLDQVVIEPGQLWIMDRNFCVRTFLFGILRSGAFFLVRRHASTLPFEPDRAAPVGRPV